MRNGCRDLQLISSGVKGNAETFNIMYYGPGCDLSGSPGSIADLLRLFFVGGLRQEGVMFQEEVTESGLKLRRWPPTRPRFSSEYLSHDR